MKIVIAPDKFKGSLTSFDVCDAFESGLLNASPEFEIIKLPMADGGDDLSEVIAHYIEATVQTASVLDPLFRPVDAMWLLAKDGCSAFIEMAKASGLSLLKPDEYNPEKTSTVGTGQLIKAAIEKGVTNVTIGIGGSATNDCGIGMAASLGYRFLDAKGNNVKAIGENLIRIAHIEAPSPNLFSTISFLVACDVKNLLCGEQGATNVYAPQKGATPAMVERLEQGMLHVAGIIKKDLGVDVLSLEGGGAAGGAGAGCVTFLGAKLERGIDLVMHISRIEDYMKDADIVITGEGKIDHQSVQGKVISGIAMLAKKYQKPVFAFCGSSSLTAQETDKQHIKTVFPIVNFATPLEDAIKNAAPLLQKLAFQAGQSLLSMQAS